MLRTLLTFSLCGLLLTAMQLNAQPEFSTGGSEQCLGCHDYGKDSPVHAMLAGRHGSPDNEGSPMTQGGCEDCHGPSANHTRSPTQVSPGISFGPRWTNTIAAQDGQCLACHGADTLEHWQDALHMVNDLTCVTCHDVHQPQDKVLAEATQAEVCTVCHKVQKEGIHGLPEHSEDNPACTSCHNPHDDRSAVHSMLDNRSEGCRSCHDLVQMAGDSDASSKAASYHKVMVQADRTCLDCHQDIAHAAADSAAPMVPTAAQSRQVTLFYPGGVTRDWLLSDHPGAQPLRQGRNCQQCHRGEEADMGQMLAESFSPGTRELDVSFALAKDELQVTIAWDGPADDASLSLLWGDRHNDALQRGGCFAACHSDSMYLADSRSQERLIGQPALTKEPGELQQMMDEGNFAELWRIDLISGELGSARMLDKLNWQQSTLLSGSATHSNGRWVIKLQRDLAGDKYYKTLAADELYTFGIALEGANYNSDKHWVSLPMTLRFNGGDTDFKAK